MNSPRDFCIGCINDDYPEGLLGEIDELEKKLATANKRIRELEADVERLKTVPMKYRRMAFNAQLQDENAILLEVSDKLEKALEKTLIHINSEYQADIDEETREVLTEVEAIRRNKVAPNKPKELYETL